jgi:hypothetical protein
MDALSWKVRIIVLWFISAEAMSAHMIMVTIDPVPMQKMMAWGATINAAGWMFAAIYWLIPLWLAFVTIAVKGPSNRWVNFVLGIIATILNLYHFFMCGVPIVNPVLFSEPTWHHSLLLATALAATVLITRYAWKWPKQEA